MRCYIIFKDANIKTVDTDSIRMNNSNLIVNDETMYLLENIEFITITPPKKVEEN